MRCKRRHRCSRALRIKHWAASLSSIQSISLVSREIAAVKGLGLLAASPLRPIKAAMATCQLIVTMKELVS